MKFRFFIILGLVFTSQFLFEGKAYCLGKNAAKIVEQKQLLISSIVNNRDSQAVLQKAEESIQEFERLEREILACHGLTLQKLHRSRAEQNCDLKKLRIQQDAVHAKYKLCTGKDAYGRVLSLKAMDKVLDFVAKKIVEDRIQSQKCSQAKNKGSVPVLDKKSQKPNSVRMFLNSAPMEALPVEVMEPLALPPPAFLSVGPMPVVPSPAERDEEDSDIKESMVSCPNDFSNSHEPAPRSQNFGVGVYGMY